MKALSWLGSYPNHPNQIRMKRITAFLSESTFDFALPTFDFHFPSEVTELLFIVENVNAFFDTLIIITLPCEFANHRAGSQLKISGNSELPPAFIAILAGNQLHV